MAIEIILMLFFAGLVTGVLLFAFIDLISWPQALVTMAGATIGGYSAARYARKIPQSLLQGCVIFLGFALSIFYFLK